MIIAALRKRKVDKLNKELYSLIENGFILNVDHALELINKGADANLQNSEGDTALSLASRRHSAFDVKAFIDLGADVNHVDNRGRSVLIKAIKSTERLEKVKHLIDASVNVNDASSNLEDIPLCLACKYGKMETIKALLIAKANPNVCNKNGEHPLGLAIRSGEYSLFTASKDEFSQAIEALLKHGADVFLKDRSGLGALDYVVNPMSKNGGIAKELIEAHIAGFETHSSIERQDSISSVFGR